jgi:putative SbcD/Mre11-related phosphoesterase
MAVSDIHYGYEIHRSRQGALLPNWGMQQCLTTLLALLQDHQPERLILVGDIMDGTSSVVHTNAFLDQLKPHVPQLVLIEGNHDRTGLKKAWQLQKTHQERGFLFHHGHRTIAPPSVPSLHEEVHITGHAHPAVSFNDGAGLQLKIPAFIQQKLLTGEQNWILPAFSPWASGGRYHSQHQPLATWACAPTRIWQM